MYVSEVLTAEENEKCWQAFQQFDKDGNGTIDFFELRAMLHGTTLSPSGRHRRHIHDAHTSPHVHLSETARTHIGG